MGNKTPKKKILPLTAKQNKLFKLITENYGRKGGVKSLGELLTEAGYSIHSANNPKKILVSPPLQEEVGDFIEELDKKRKLAMKHITEKKIEHTSAYSLALITDILTKNHQLLSGKETERHGFNLSDAEKAKIDKIFDDNTKK